MSVLDTRWVPKLSKDNFSQWRALWDIASGVYLNKSRFNKNGLDRVEIYKLALLKAAEGNNTITMDLLTIFKITTTTHLVDICESYVNKLEELYLPNAIDKKMTVVRNIKNFSRYAGESLKNLLSRFDKLMVEAEMVDYKPEEDTKLITLMHSFNQLEKNTIVISIDEDQCTYAHVRKAADKISKLDNFTSNNKSERLEGAIRMLFLPITTKNIGRSLSLKIKRKKRLPIV
eukprot:GHVR01121331.1.p1 GENE.GHVR01121331.1~~GHVR01121331.1.p1  ORF type:complete len:255 (-),score=29.51 GHVR01121331.1:758-1450(-)